MAVFLISVRHTWTLEDDINLLRHCLRYSNGNAVILGQTLLKALFVYHGILNRMFYLGLYPNHE